MKTPLCVCDIHLEIVAEDSDGAKEHNEGGLE